MNYQKLNEVLKDLRKIKLPKVVEEQSKDFYHEKNQGEEGQKITIYNLGFDNMYLKVIEYSNSYGEERGCVGIQFVKPVTKSITDYESI